MTTRSSAIRWTIVITLLMVVVTVANEHGPLYWASMGCLVSGIAAIWIAVWRARMESENG